MASEGILVVIININMEARTLLAKPMVTTRGFILINENEELITKIENLSEKVITKALKLKRTTYADIKTELSKELNTFIKEETGRKPIVLPIILNIKKEKESK
jgi:ribonuclease J